MGTRPRRHQGLALLRLWCAMTLAVLVGAGTGFGQADTADQLGSAAARRDLPLGAGAAPIGAPIERESVLAPGSLIRTVLSLAIVVALIVLCAAIVRKVAATSGGLAGALGPGGRAPSGLLEVLGRYPIARGQTLVLLRLDQRVLLLSQNSGRLRAGAGGFATLAEITDGAEVASILTQTRDEEGDSMAARFRTILSGFDDTHDQADDDVLASFRVVEPGPDGGVDGSDRVELLSESQAPSATDPTRSLRARLDSLRMADGAGAMGGGA